MCHSVDSMEPVSSKENIVGIIRIHDRHPKLHSDTFDIEDLTGLCFTDRGSKLPIRELEGKLGLFHDRDWTFPCSANIDHGDAIARIDNQPTTRDVSEHALNHHGMAKLRACRHHRVYMLSVFFPTIVDMFDGFLGLGLERGSVANNQIERDDHILKQANYIRVHGLG